MYPEDVAALFPLIPVGTKVWLINEPVKVAFAAGELLMEAHPPVDDEGQNTAEPDMELLSQKLDQALGTTTAAIHWDFAKQALQAANGIPVVVGLQADMDPAQAAAAIESGGQQDASATPGAEPTTPATAGAGATPPGSGPSPTPPGPAPSATPAQSSAPAAQATPPAAATAPPTAAVAPR
jgi:hypothetical protein